LAGSHGHFELNVFKPMIAHNILQSIDLIADSTRNFAIYCVRGIKANKRRIKEHLDNSLMLVTALAPHIGYDNAAKITKTALKNNTSLKHETLKTKLIKEKDYERIVDPKKMIYPS
jgi:fumarate hydratase class II